jgi:hypothetical protein
MLLTEVFVEMEASEGVGQLVRKQLEVPRMASRVGTM